MCMCACIDLCTYVYIYIWVYVYVNMYMTISFSLLLLRLSRSPSLLITGSAPPLFTLVSTADVLVVTQHYSEDQLTKPFFITLGHWSRATALRVGQHSSRHTSGYTILRSINQAVLHQSWPFEPHHRSSRWTAQQTR